MRARRVRDERGSGTVLTIAATTVLVSLSTVLLIGGGYLIGWRQAANSADLTALSAATAAGGLTPDPGVSRVSKDQASSLCAVAKATARANGAQLVECKVRGVLPAVVVAVEVQMTVSPPVRGLPTELPAKAWASSAEIG